MFRRVEFENDEIKYYKKMMKRYFDRYIEMSRIESNEFEFRD